MKTVAANFGIRHAGRPLSSPFLRTPMLLSLPEELLECILYECLNTGHKALRSTCVLLCRLATPLVFETLVVDAYMFPAKSLDRLRAIVSGKGFAQYVRHLRLFTLKLPKGKPKGPFDRIFFNKRRARKSRKLEKLLVAAISSMTSLRTVKLLGCDEKIPYLPCVSMLSVRLYGQSTFINSSFPYLTKLSITGPSYFKFASILMSNSPNLSSLGIYDHGPFLHHPCPVSLPKIPKEHTAPSWISGFAGTCPCTAPTYLS